MKDVPHHMADFIKNFSKDESPKDDKVLKKFNKKRPKSQEKKQKKAKKRKAEKMRIPAPVTPEECNKKIKKRTPQIRERSHKTTI